ncbi:alcohol dehydrogenase [Rhizorhabdus wittichii DC-6]|nr:alcohol dehydrogenase [Rhizorhabdus wittichii DC-6]
MRAAIFHGAGKPMTIEDVPDPEPGPGEAVIKVCRCGICGSDIGMTSGSHADYPAGTTLGHEYAGEVVAVGRDVSNLKVGQRVSAMPAKGCGGCASCLAGFPLGCTTMAGMIGGFGEYMRIYAPAAIHLPDTLSMADGALVEPLAVGLRGVALAGLRPGATVAVLGAGAVGLAAIYWARLLGAGRIVAMSRSARRADLATAMGADGFEAFGEGEGDRLAAALGGLPDAVLECAGAVGLMQKAVELVRPGGTIVSLGFCGSPDPIIPSLATWKQVTMKFSFAYDLREFQHCADALDAGHVAPRMMVSETIGLDALPSGFEALRTGSTQTKVHVDPWIAA